MATDKTLNLNADLGESFGAWRMGDDAALLRIVQSANLACGFHAGDPPTMRKSIAAALACGVSIGAHPSYPDLQGFGRRSMRCSSEEVEALLLYQIGALDGMARAQGGRVTHVKPHGALSNDACSDRTLADVVARAVRAYDPGLILLAPALSHLTAAGEAAGLVTIAEIFADRAYLDDATLAPRQSPGAVLHGAENCLAHVGKMLALGGVVTMSGKILPTPIGSICVHGDGPDAVAIASALRNRLEADGYALRCLPQLAH